MHTTRWTGDLPPPAVRASALASDMIQGHGQQVLLARKLEIDTDREKSDLEELARRWYLKVRLRKAISCCILLCLLTSSYCVSRTT